MARLQTVAGYTVEQYASPNIGGTMTGHRGVVLHIAQGTYRGTIAWQMNPDQRYQDGTEVTTSSTWILGRNAGEVAQMVDSDRIAWAQRGGSRDWNSIELAGYAPNPPTAWQIEACAHILAWLHRTYGVPIQVTNLTSGAGLGHHSMDNDTTVEWGHDACPGAGVIAAKSAIAEMAANLGGTEVLTDDDVARLAKAVWDHRIASPGLNRTAAAADWQKDAYGYREEIPAILAGVKTLMDRPPVTVDVVQLAELLYNALPGGGLTREEVRAACEEAVRAVAQDAGTP